MITNEYVVLVDQTDNSIGIEEKLIAHQKGLLHRAFSVFIFSLDRGEKLLLLQQRNPQKYHCGNLWTNTCCSHPRPDETIVEGSQRRLYEEMGITLTLQQKGHFIYKTPVGNDLIEHEYDHVVVGFTDFTTCKIKPNPDEVAAFTWVSVKTLYEDIDKNPQMYTPWLRQALDIACLTHH